MRTWRRGEFDVWRILLGVNGCGKSTRAGALALEYARQGVRVFVHDPDGQHAPFPAYASPAGWTSAAATAHAAKGTLPLVARITGGEPIDVLELAASAAEATNVRTPSLVVLDEGSTLWDEGRRDVFTATLLKFVTRRRNIGVGAVVLYQWAMMLHYLLLANSTHLELFRLEDEHQARYLRRFLAPQLTLAGGGTAARDAVLGRLPYLDRGEFYAVMRGFRQS